jgi:hypothetical protein
MLVSMVLVSMVQLAAANEFATAMVTPSVVAQTAAPLPAPSPQTVSSMFSFSTDPTVPQAVNDGFVLSMVGGFLCPFGSLWVPLLAVKGGDLSGDTVVSWLVPYAIAIVISFTVIGCLAAPVLVWMSTVATLNGMARNSVGLRGGVGTAPAGKPVTPAPTPAPTGGAAGPTPAYAY